MAGIATASAMQLNTVFQIVTSAPAKENGRRAAKTRLPE
jgi:hypothetical protein